MAGGRGARKSSKKGWRRGLDAGGEAGEGAKEGARRAAAARLEAVPDAELFVLDGVGGEQGPAAAGTATASGAGAGRRGRRGHKPHETSHSLRAHSSGVAGLGNRPLKKLRKAQVQERQERGQRALQARMEGGVRGGAEDRGEDLWVVVPEPSPEPAFPPTLEVETGKKRLGKAKVAHTIVDPQGCSYNPTYEAHQDVLAEAVAAEAAKEHKKQLSRARWLLEVPAVEEAGSGPDRCAGGAFGAVESDSKEEGGAEDGVDAQTGEGRTARKRTRSDLNRRMRRKEAERQALQRERTQRATRQIDNLKAIKKEIEEEDEYMEARRRGRTPKEFARLGRKKYTPAPIQVLATDEVKGSIRSLNSCATVSHVVQDSLFRAGVMEPRNPTKVAILNSLSL